MFFWNSLAFSMIQRMLAIWPLVPLLFLNPAWTSGSSQLTYYWNLAWRILSITLLSMWDECSCAVVWTFLVITLLRDWNENWPLPVRWPLLRFLNLLAYWGSTFTASSFKIWNSSTGIPSPPLALFIVSDFTFTFYFHALEKEMATHSSVLAWRTPGMGEPGGSLRSITLLSFIEPIFAWNVPLVSLIFLKRSLVFPILLFSSIYLHWPLRKASLSFFAILWNSAFKWVYLSFSPLHLTKGKGQLLYIKYIRNKDLLYSTGNYSQYLVITYAGK